MGEAERWTAVDPDVQLRYTGPGTIALLCIHAPVLISESGFSDGEG
jgi:hypothetical protein